MARIKGDVLIARPVEEVFDFVVDERNEPRFNPNMISAELLSEGPIGEGSRFRAQIRMMGRAVPMLVEYVACRPPSSITSHATMSGMETQGTLTLEPVGDMTRLHWCWDVRMRGALRLLAPLTVPVGRRQERAMWVNLKRYLEAPQGDIRPRPPGSAGR